MFTTYDSYTYCNASNEFYNFSETGFSNFRPFLYPLIINLILKPFGATGLWLMQLAFWMVSINLIFLAIKNTTKSRTLSYIGSGIIALNFSYIGLTMQCLTEVSTVFLLSLLVYYTSINIAHLKSLRFFHGALFILILLTVLKPVFFLPTLFMLFIILPLFYLKKYISAPKKIVVLALITLPLLYQLTLMKVKYDTFSVSQISTETLRNYLLAQGVQQNENISLAEARQKIKNFSDADVSSYLTNNKLLYTKIYFQNLKANMNAFSSFLIGPRGFIYTSLGSYMIVVNTFYFSLHLIFILPLIFILFYAFKERKNNFNFILLLSCALLVYYIFLTSPVSFNEGDRLIITSMPVWVFLYAMVVNYIKDKGKELRKFYSLRK
jgi:hypothetical protein